MLSICLQTNIRKYVIVSQQFVSLISMLLYLWNTALAVKYSCEVSDWFAVC